jgi:hypothetical protein
MAKAKKPAKGSKKKAGDKPALPPPPAEDIAEIAGSEADYEKLLPLAQTIDLRDVVSRRADIALACHNARKGTEEVLEQQAMIAEHLPRVKVADLTAIPQIASALAFASLRLDHLTHPDTGVRELLAQARPLRRLLLGSARVLADARVLEPKAVKKIEVGAGPIDTADDLVALASLFSTHAAKVKGKSPVTHEQVKQAAAVGAKLRSLLKPKRASKSTAPTDEMAKAAEVRDRFWALLAQRYDLVWRIGAYVFGKDEVAARVPSLQAFAAARRSTRPGAVAEPGSPEEKAPG